VLKGVPVTTDEDTCSAFTSACTCAALGSKVGCGWSRTLNTCMLGKITECTECPAQRRCATPTTPSPIAKKRASDQGRSYAKQLLAQNVELMAFDWDQTANEIHTFNGKFESIYQVASTISPDYIDITLAWCEQGKPNAIVTYQDEDVTVAGSRVSGPYMIRRALDLVLPKECAKNIYIDAANLSFDPRLGKNPHLQNAKRRFKINSSNRVMLVDDTYNNIKQAIRSGYQTTYVTPAAGFDYDDFNFVSEI